MIPGGFEIPGDTQSEHVWSLEDVRGWGMFSLWEMCGLLRMFGILRMFGLLRMFRLRMFSAQGMFSLGLCRSVLRALCCGVRAVGSVPGGLCWGLCTMGSRG